MKDVISLANVTVRSGEQTILDKLDLAVPNGSLRVLLGGSGTGKTTLFRLLTAEILPDSGTIQIGETALHSLHASHRPKFRRSIGVVFQDAPLVSNRTTEGQILLPMELMGMRRNRRRETLENTLARFQLLSARNVYPKKLSMGMRQRIAIARAVATEPLVLLADEPAAHLDTTTQQEIARIFQQENLRGMTVLIGTSNEHFASYFPSACVESFPPSSQSTS